MENSQKIWKYMDLAKLISLLSEQALNFACPSEFQDPYEGYMPKIWAKDYAKNKQESEAMWKLYSASGQGIAIESTIGRLTDSILDKENLEIESVHYFSENNPGEFNGQLDPLFLKRNSFEHEKELRAAISLKTKGNGTFVKCDLDKLISHIHVSPLVKPYFRDIVENICKGKIRKINKPVTRSALFDKPNYTLTALLSL